LLKANWKDGRFEGYDIPRGSFATSVKTLSEELSSKNQKFSIQSVRTSLKHLISTKELTIKTTSKFTIISVNNYDYYQEGNKVSNNQLTNSQQTTNKQLTTIEEYKKNRYIYSSTTTKEQNIFEFVEKHFGRTLSPTECEVIDKWEDNELTRYAIKQAELARAFSVKYIDKILTNYKKENITTITEAEERDKKFQENKKHDSQKKMSVFEILDKMEKEENDEQRRNSQDS